MRSVCLFQLPSMTRQFRAVNLRHQRANSGEYRHLRRSKRGNYPLHSTPKRQHSQQADMRGDIYYDVSSFSQASDEHDVTVFNDGAARESPRHSTPKRHHYRRSQMTRQLHDFCHDVSSMSRLDSNDMNAGNDDTNSPLHSTPKRQHHSQMTGQLCQLYRELSSVSKSVGMTDMVMCDEDVAKKVELHADVIDSNVINGDKADSDAVDVSPPWTDTDNDDVKLHTGGQQKNMSESQLKFWQCDMSTLLAATDQKQCKSPTSTTCGLHGNHLKEVISKVVGAVLGTDLLCSWLSTTANGSSSESDRSCDNVAKVDKETQVTLDGCQPCRVTGDVSDIDTGDVSSLQLLDSAKDNSGTSSLTQTAVTVDDIKTRMTILNVDDIAESLPVTTSEDNAETTAVTKCADINTAMARTLHTITTRATIRTRKRKHSHMKVAAPDTPERRQRLTPLRKSVATSDMRRNIQCNHSEATVPHGAKVFVQYMTSDHNSHMTQLQRRTLEKRLRAAVHMRSEFTTLVQF